MKSACIILLRLPQVVGVSYILLPSIEQWEGKNLLSHSGQQPNCHQSLNCKIFISGQRQKEKQLAFC